MIEAIRWIDMHTLQELEEQPTGWSRPVIKCDCGEDVACYGRSNECEGCGSEYDEQGFFKSSWGYWCEMEFEQ